MYQKLSWDWLPLLGVRRAPERLLVMKSLRSPSQELMRALLQCLGRSQLAWINLSDGSGLIFTGLTPLADLRASGDDFFVFGLL
jgi:hypothetical protein